jgi:hypothetical protein
MPGSFPQAARLTVPANCLNETACGGLCRYAALASEPAVLPLRDRIVLNAHRTLDLVLVTLLTCPAPTRLAPVLSRLAELRVDGETVAVPCIAKFAVDFSATAAAYGPGACALAERFGARVSRAPLSPPLTPANWIEPVGIWDHDDVDMVAVADMVGPVSSTPLTRELLAFVTPTALALLALGLQLPTATKLQDPPLPLHPLFALALKDRDPDIGWIRADPLPTAVDVENNAADDEIGISPAILSRLQLLPPGDVVHLLRGVLSLASNPALDGAAVLILALLASFLATKAHSTPWAPVAGLLGDVIASVPRRHPALAYILSHPATKAAAAVAVRDPLGGWRRAVASVALSHSALGPGANTLTLASLDLTAREPTAPALLKATC